MMTQSKSPQKAGRVDWPLIAFFVLAYALAWGVQGLLISIAGRAGLDVEVLAVSAENLRFDTFRTQLTVSPWLIYGLTRLQDFAFSIAGLLMIAYVSGVAGLRELWDKLTRWQFGWRIYLVALLPLGLYGLAVVITAATNDNILGTIDLSPRAAASILFGAQSGLLVYLFTRGPLGEELGLRGFALPRLQQRYSPFASAAIIGVLWALWHLPVLFGRDLVSVIAFLLLAFGLSFVFTWLFNKSGQSLIPALLFHTTQNAEEIWEVVFPNLTTVDWELSSTLLLLLIGISFGIVLWRSRSDFNAM